MRKLISTVLLAATSVIAFAQGSETSTAIIRLREGDVAQAKMYIDKAYEVTMAKRAKGETISEKIDSKFWYYRGEIYFQIHISKKPELSELSANPLNIATESFIELFKIDVNQRYSKEGKEKFMFCVNGYVNKAFDAIERKEWIEAMNFFETAYSLKQTPEFGNVIDTLTLYNAGLMAQFGEDYDNAIRINRELINMNYGGATTYVVLAQLYKSKGDIEGSFNAVQEGRVIYPSDKDLLIEEVNYHIKNNDKEKALSTLELAIAADPNNALLHNAYGTILLQLGDEDKAETALLQAVALNDSIAEAYYSLGAIQVERANVLVEKMNAKGIKEADYNKLKAQQKKHFEDSLPYFERALFLNPEDIYTLDALKVVYYKLDMDEKSMEMKKRLDALKG
jgi:tetratricopeptide (TPR) repeat protein